MTWTRGDSNDLQSTLSQAKLSRSIFAGGLAFAAAGALFYWWGAHERSVENRVSIHDLHATLLNQLGVDHTRLTYRYAGRDFRLTDVQGEVVKDVLV